MNIVRSRRALVAGLLALALPLTLAACGEDEGNGTDAAQEESTPTEDPTSEATAAAEELHVVAEDFKFVGLPDTMAAGTYTIHFENAGTEPHEIAIAQLLTDTPVSELLALPEKKVMKEIKPVGGTFAKPGEAAAKPLEAEFEAGNYVAVCFVTNKKGPHALQGMVHEFTVE